MNNQDNDASTKPVPIRDLKIEPEAEDLLDSAAMEPYINLAMAVMGHKDVGPAVREIEALPLEKRYTWRVASALKWAFTDFENLNVAADRRTLSQHDLDKLVELLKIRPLQFCMFLAALYGDEQMEKLIASSVQQVKALKAKRRQALGREQESKITEEHGHMDADTIVAVIKRRRDECWNRQNAESLSDPDSGRAVQMAMDVADEYDSLLQEIEDPESK